MFSISSFCNADKKLVEQRGQLYKSARNSTIYIKNSTTDNKMIELRFSYDCSVNMMIDDMDHVIVKGYYDKKLDVILVEEIEPIMLFVSSTKDTQNIYC